MMRRLPWPLIACLPLFGRVWWEWRLWVWAWRGR
jgi:hypothetical protein